MRLRIGLRCKTSLDPSKPLFKRSRKLFVIEPASRKAWRLIHQLRYRVAPVPVVHLLEHRVRQVESSRKLAPLLAPERVYGDVGCKEPFRR